MSVTFDQFYGQLGVCDIGKKYLDIFWDFINNDN